MKRAIGDLASLRDERLFRGISEGIPLIVENAVSLDETARRLHRDKEFRVSEIIRGFAEEEAAKVLILIDLVRCPRDQQKRREVARRFYGHVAKRIYAMTCSLPNIRSFGELCDLVDQELRPYYLDGPNWVDWVVPNSILAEREQSLYVDYVRDITDEAGDCYWNTPYSPASARLQYETPECVKLSKALSEAGANSPKGLAVIADTWRGFKPDSETDRKRLWNLIALTLDQLSIAGQAVGDDSIASNLIIESWSFPLWSLTITEPRASPEELNDLREQRTRTIEWIQSTEAKRDPPPAISRSTVEALGNAYAAWRREVDSATSSSPGRKKGGIRFRSSEEIKRDFELPSYARAEGMFRKLDIEERAALLALGWFARERVADWPRIYERARQQVSTVSHAYQIGYGAYWLAGLDRWKKKPRPFTPGQRAYT